MSELKIDLTNCDREAIHIPGNIQPHGFILAIDTAGIISYCSDNIFALAGIRANTLLGSHLSIFVNVINRETSASPILAMVSLFRAGHDYGQLNPGALTIHGKDYNLIISESGNYLLLEIEPALLEEQGILQKMIGHSLSRMMVDKNLDHLISNTAEQIRSVIGFDRVMIYKFAADGHGEVVAESKTEELPSWIGQHFPASDIPQQARALYKLNLTRLIANVNDVPSGLLALSGLEALDLTNGQLRAVSPIHIQYLKNMGVASSFSISLIYKKELWGLIACHHYSPKFIEFSTRESAKLIGQILSSALEFRQDELNYQIHENFNVQIDKLSRQMMKDESLVDALTTHDTNLLSVLEASGAVLVFEKTVTVMGSVPEKTQLEPLLVWLQTNIKNQLFHTDHLAAVYPLAKDFKAIGSGMMLLIISKELNEYIIFFKPEQLSSISWAGNPEKEPGKIVDGLLHISPRHSFESWAEIVTGKSLPWTGEEIQSATRLKQEITYAINIRANAIRSLNEKLSLAYEELDTFSYTISHDLKNPVTSMKVYAQLLQRDLSLGGRSRQIALKMELGADKMNRMIEEVLEYSRIGRSKPQYKVINSSLIIKEIAEELKIIYHVNQPDIVLGELHHLYGDETMMIRVFANLIGNAVKYSQQNHSPKIEIGSVMEDHQVRFTIRDNGIGIKPIDLPKIFDLFSRMSNVGEIEGSGVGLAIVKRIIDQHKGKIWAESNHTGGSVFHLCLDKAITN
jgi:chemotaxis family two-component system sensor kinase Cph1